MTKSEGLDAAVWVLGTVAVLALSFLVMAYIIVGGMALLFWLGRTLRIAF